MQTQQLLSLVDYLAYMTRCEYVSDLHYNMDDIKRRCAYRVLEGVPVEAYPLKEWNDALCYVTLHAPRATASEARTELMEFLIRQEETQKEAESAGRQYESETNTYQTQRRPLRGSFLRVRLSGHGLVSREPAKQTGV